MPGMDQLKNLLSIGTSKPIDYEYLPTPNLEIFYTMETTF